LRQRRAEHSKPDIDEHVALDRRVNRLERKFVVLKKAAKHLQKNAAAPEAAAIHDVSASKTADKSAEAQ
jgi:hypothetical protein